MKKKNRWWQVTPKEAIALQKKLRDKVKLTPLKKKIKYIGGADVSMNLFSTTGYGGFVTLSYPSLELLDHQIIQQKLNFPYIPGLLSFREIPILLLAWEKLKLKPDVIIVDGVGIAHPRRLGIATHLGLLLGIPTIGCAKSVLTGVYKEPGLEPGSRSNLYDKNTKEIIGVALRTKSRAKPIFISPGHLITLKEAVKIVERCLKSYRLPEPTRLAHLKVNEYRISADKK